MQQAEIGGVMGCPYDYIIWGDLQRCRPNNVYDSTPFALLQSEISSLPKTQYKSQIHLKIIQHVLFHSLNITSGCFRLKISGSVHFAPIMACLLRLLTPFVAQVRFSSTAPPSLTASLLLSRPPLLTPTPTPFESAYYSHSRSVAHALSSPLPLDFYFKTGSLPLRRHLVAEHAFVSETYGKKLSGKAPDVGDIPPETEYEIIERDRWEKADAKRGEKSLERKPEEEVYCLVLKGKDKEGKWTFPDVKVGKLEALDEAVTRGITGVEGSLGGKGMDSWLVTRKPVGMVKDGESRVRAFLIYFLFCVSNKVNRHSSYEVISWGANPHSLLPHRTLLGLGSLLLKSKPDFVNKAMRNFGRVLRGCSAYRRMKLRVDDA